jgi:hypothetical protein
MTVVSAAAAATRGQQLPLLMLPLLLLHVKATWQKP